jgi:outer membrane protein insertion porin family
MKFRLSIARSIHTTMIVALNAIAVHAAHATDSFVVEDIRVDGLRHTEPSAVFAYLQLKVGDTFTDDKASAALRALYATGLFTDVSVSVDGSTVVFDVKGRSHNDSYASLKAHGSMQAVWPCRKTASTGSVTSPTWR